MDYIPSKKLKKVCLDQESDLERLIKKGLNDFNWFKRFLENVSMEKILHHAEQEINKTTKLNEKEKQELLTLIKNKIFK